MKLLPADALAEIIGAEMIGAWPAGDTPLVAGVSTDSRTIEAGDCFFAIAGEHFDGHDHVAGAFAAGAACSVVSRPVEEPKRSDKPLLRVADTVAALGTLAAHYRRENAFKVIAVTGSVGKTTTRQIVHHVLSGHFRTHQARKNFNNHIGLPLTLLDAEPDVEIIVAELGANHPGEIGALTRIARPDVAVVTNAYPAHLAGFGDLDTIIYEKLSIAEGLPADDTLIVNGDIDSLIEAAHGLSRPLRTFGTSPGVDIRAENIESKVSGPSLHSTFTVDGHRIDLPLPGPGNIVNALAAWAVCETLGLTIHDFAEAVATLRPVAMRAEPLQIGTLTVLNDCYNANPASMRNALETLRQLKGAGPSSARRTVFICGEMGELGAESDALHADLGRAVAETGIDLLLAIGGKTKTTAAAATEASQHDLQAHCFEDTETLCKNVEHWVRPHDIILVKGSRTARLELAVEELAERFGEAAVQPIEEIAAPRTRCRPAQAKDRVQG